MKTVTKHVALVICLLAILLGALAGWVLVKHQPKQAVGAEAEANFPRPNYWALFVTAESGKYLQLIETPYAIYTTLILYDNGQYLYKWTDGTWTVLPTNMPIEIPWAFVNGEVVYATIFVDEYGVWIDLRLFDQSSDI